MATKVTGFDKTAFGEIAGRARLETSMGSPNGGGGGMNNGSAGSGTDSPLRTSANGLFPPAGSVDTSTYSSESDDEDSDTEMHMGIMENNSSPPGQGSSILLAHDFSPSSSTAPPVLVADDTLVRIGDVTIDNGMLRVGPEGAHQFENAGVTPRVKSPTGSSSKENKRTEYFNNIRSQFSFSIPPSPHTHPRSHTRAPSPPPPEGTDPEEHKRHHHRHRYSKFLTKDKEDVDPEEKLRREKERKEKKEEKKKRTDKERKELKAKVKGLLDIAKDGVSGSAVDNGRMQQILGAIGMRSPRTTLPQQRGGSIGSSDFIDDVIAKRDNPQVVPPLRRSNSSQGEEIWKRNRNIPKYERILGPAIECPPLSSSAHVTAITNADEAMDKSLWRKTKKPSHESSKEKEGSEKESDKEKDKDKDNHKDRSNITISSAVPPPSPPTPPANAANNAAVADLIARSGSVPISTDPVLRSSDKLAKFFGEMHVPKAGSVYNVQQTFDGDAQDTTPSTPVVVAEPEQEEGIIFGEMSEGVPFIRGATLKKLVERLTYDSYSDPKFLNQFVITYRSFTNPHQLLELLRARFECPVECRPDSTEAEMEVIQKKIQIVRIRIYNVIKHWINKQWVDFMEDPTLVEKMRAFGAAIDEVSKNKGKVDKMINDTVVEGERKKTLMFSKPPPKSYIPSVSGKDKLTIHDLHPLEIARQMTLIEYELFKSIKPWEYLSWNTKQKQTKSANIVAMVNKFNEVNRWVQKEVLAVETPKQRAAMIAKFLEICEHLQEIKNYNGFMEILSGLNKTSVFRLKQSWGHLSSKQSEMFAEFNKLLSNDTNYKNLRNALHTLEPPCIPYLGMYLTDLTFINDGIPLYLPENGLINFDKCRKVSASVQELMQYQQTPYCLTDVDEVRDYLLAQSEIISTDDEFYKLSLAREERAKV